MVATLDTIATALGSLNVGDWLGLLGISIAFAQITRTGRIVRKTKKAVDSASARAAVYNVLHVAPRLSSLETEIHYAVKTDDVDRLAILFRSYKDLVAELDGLLHQEEKHSDDAKVKLTKSMAQVTAFKIPRTVTSDEKSLYDRTVQVRKSISDATSATVTLTARLRSDLTPLTVGSDENPKKSFARFFAPGEGKS